MGYVQFILDNRKKAQAASPPASDNSEPSLPDLPGIHRRERQLQYDIAAQKREYNRALHELQHLAKNRKSLKGEKKKEAGKRMGAIRQHMDDLLTRIGTYTPDETVYGFAEKENEY